MRISDWSSDVCSSDLLEAVELAIDGAGQAHPQVVDGVPFEDEDAGKIGKEIKRIQLVAGRQEGALPEAEPVVAEEADFRAGGIGNALDRVRHHLTPPLRARRRPWPGDRPLPIASSTPVALTLATDTKNGLKRKRKSCQKVVNTLPKEIGRA